MDHGRILVGVQVPDAAAFRAFAAALGYPQGERISNPWRWQGLRLCRR